MSKIVIRGISVSGKQVCEVLKQQPPVTRLTQSSSDTSPQLTAKIKVKNP